MRKRIVITAATLAASLQYGAAQNMIADVWKSMPDSIIPILNANARSEVVEMQKFGPEAKTKNLLGGGCRLIRITDKMIDVKLTDKTGVQLLLLEKADSTRLVCMNRYYGSTQADSDIDFYTEEWKKDTSIMVPTISTDEYFRFCATAAGCDFASAQFDRTATVYPVITAASLSDRNGGELLLTAYAPLAIAKGNETKDTPELQKSFKWNGTLFK